MVIQIYIDGRILLNYEIVLLARNDGFESSVHFLEWFNKSYEGKIIHWTNFKY